MIRDKLNKIVFNGMFEGAIGTVSPKRRNDYVKAILSLFHSSMLEVIGGDYLISKLHPSDYAKHVNEFKAELRSKLSELLGK